MDFYLISYTNREVYERKNVGEYFLETVKNLSDMAKTTQIIRKSKDLI